MALHFLLVRGTGFKVPPHSSGGKVNGGPPRWRDVYQRLHEPNMNEI